MSGPVLVFSRPFRAPDQERYISEVLASGHVHGDGPFTTAASELLQAITEAPRALLTTSCTHALELAGVLLDLGPGDEVIVPSFTFSSTAAAIAIRGATPVFVDIDPRTLCLDVDLAAAAVTERTRALYTVHYGGVGHRLDELTALCDRHGLVLVEDNAHGLGARWRGRSLGTFGALATQSFHDTKNVHCGEGGALLINDVQRFAERAEIIREKGTNRGMFLRGQVDKYTWVDAGSSYLPSDLLAALLLAQLESFEQIQAGRMAVWERYARDLTDWARQTGASLMQVPDDVEHPAHVFYLLMPDHAGQVGLLGHLKERGVIGTFHYQPLDSSPAGQRLGRTPVPCSVTADVASRLVRLPLWPDLTEPDLDRIVAAVTSYPGASASYPGASAS
ncbi:dTDP-4-amino-4,6-dideoxygalactose transaminase [Ornithinimicrobium sp. F0845]|uniref:dTDP-4-amino-4,6-dideoxygalactose transaminase n=1 Tax=Ornithinimicrobium sp. F0845 TaxID=2926412 RepID=UPI001FF2869A|nr:dTDP-4-amino-4,6-dideoxygalactose transaminase [Ornithinimicrobium sp. F0845]MCK0113501.1 dTDP-4-amino-4,6-dideoxygalactose transaminase [Ornithinimicrobium sp. F0845]